MSRRTPSRGGGRRFLIGRGGERGQDYGQQESQPFEQAREVVASGGEDGVGGVALGSGEVVSAHAMLGFGVSDDRFDRGAAAQLAFDGLGDATSLARETAQQSPSDRPRQPEASGL